MEERSCVGRQRQVLADERVDRTGTGTAHSAPGTWVVPDWLLQTPLHAHRGGPHMSHYPQTNPGRGHNQR